VPLTEVEWRIDSAPFDRSKDNAKIARYVPYVTASICARLLDEWVGPFNWYDTYTQTTIAGVDAMVCSLHVRLPGTEVFLVKQGVGVSPGGSDEMKAKGAVSDSFKRASSLKWGVARNVYQFPSLWAICKVQKRGDRETARPHPEAEAELLEQLQARGFEWDGKLVTGGE
jgi:hypothetical protein